MCNITRPPCSQSHFKIHILGQIIQTKIKDCFDIKRCTHIWPTQQIHALYYRKLSIMLNLKSHLKKPNFEDQTIEAKIRDHFDIRILESDLQSKCTSLYHSRISIMPNLRFHFETHTFRIWYNTVTRHQAKQSVRKSMK